MASLSFTWLGHSTFLFVSPGGKRILIDPWLTTNPVCPDESKRITTLDLVLVTHGHDDHTADVVSVARATGARVVAPYELGLWLERKGLPHVRCDVHELHGDPSGSREIGTRSRIRLPQS